ncbi:hypothetical protein CK203_077943 [Vitis vinifera]|uniref:Reverse transcriptase zinc-binding domain-containing protein n=1 Tax=Vitis vinifera TaxID=29760 RepID=A0A438EB73_VITVI|nr:hypothetical protein CK203_077943 [Vitis vinifera]
MPLGAPFKSIGVWDGIEKDSERDWLCGSEYISKGGRITLIRVLCPTFRSISCPSSIYLGRQSKGGLGVKSLGLFNKALWANGLGALLTKKRPLESGDQKEVREEIGGWRSSEIGRLMELEGSWTPTFNRSFNDWEMEEVGRLLCYLEGKMVRVDEEDRVSWVKSKDGFFRCFLCQKCGESIDHLLLHCERTRRCGLCSSLSLEFLGFFAFGEETLIGWRGSFVGKKRKVAWLLAVMLVLGYLED